MDKYDKWIKEKKTRKKVSIIELGILAKRLGIDANAIRDKHLGAIFEELIAVVNAKGITIGEVKS